MRFGLVSAKTGLLHILNNFKVEPCHETSHRIQYVEKSIVNRPKDSIKLKFIPVEKT